jgi:hypothetical protein
MAFLDDTIELIELASLSGVTYGPYITAKALYLAKYQDLQQLEDLFPVSEMIDDGNAGFEYPDPDKVLQIRIP